MKPAGIDPSPVDIVSSSPGAAQIVLFAFLGEGALLLAGLGWILLRDLPLTWGEPVPAMVAGLAGAGTLAIAQYAILRHAPPIAPVRSLRRLHQQLLVPMFRHSRLAEIVAISILAGVGEEMLFRGAMQPEWGLLTASLVFGACHVGNRLTVPLGIWAACTGLLLGWLAMITGGLLAPLVAHITYDAIALGYLRWGPDLAT